MLSPSVTDNILPFTSLLLLTPFLFTPSLNIITSLLYAAAPPCPHPALAADPDPKLDTNSILLAWDNLATAPVAELLFFPPSNVKKDMPSSQAADAFLTSLLFLMMTLTLVMGVTSPLLLSPARVCDTDMDGEGTSSSSSMVGRWTSSSSYRDLS